MSTKLPLYWRGHRISIRQDRYLRMRSDPISSHQSLVEINIGSHLNYEVRDVISRYFHILKNDPETSAIFTVNPLISFRRNKNIRDNLVRSAIRQNLPAPAGSFSCSRALCYTCSFLNSATSIPGPKSNFVIRHRHLLQHHLLHFLH